MHHKRNESKEEPRKLQAIHSYHISLVPVRKFNAVQPAKGDALEFPQESNLLNMLNTDKDQSKMKGTGKIVPPYPVSDHELQETLCMHDWNLLILDWYRQDSALIVSTNHSVNTDMRV